MLLSFVIIKAKFRHVNYFLSSVATVARMDLD